MDTYTSKQAQEDFKKLDRNWNNTLEFRMKIKLQISILEHLEKLSNK